MTVTYTPLPPAPVPGASDFEVQAGVFLDAMPQFGAEMKAIADDVAENATLVDVEGNATIAATAASQASISAAQAGNSATASGASASSALVAATAARRDAEAAALSALQAGTNAVAAAESATAAAASAALADSAGNATSALESKVAAQAARDVAIAQASIATTKAADSAASAVVSQTSSQTAANAVYSQLLAVKTQTEEARDAAIAGLGAADNSPALAELLGGISYATDMALQAVRELMRVDASLTPQIATHDLLLEQLTYQATHLADIAGAIGRAISGGTVALQGGTAAIPSLTSATDVTAGVFFPAAGVVALATSALERLRVTADGRLGIGTTAPSGLLDVADSKIRIRTAQTPASATAAGNQGEMAWDASYVYVCTATNTWKRAALASW